MNYNELVQAFAAPDARHRGAPFWAWNGRLDKQELLRQIHIMHDMGMGGFFMHSRTGLVNEYLGDEWFELINACVDEATRLGLNAWLYDEDRWPSGTAGGMVTRNPAFRAKFLRLECEPGETWAWKDEAVATFACNLDGVAFANCRRLHHRSNPVTASETVLFFYVKEAHASAFYNGCTDVDRLSRDATIKFIELTHEQYKQRCGGRLGKGIVGVFTDEPHRQGVFTSFGSGTTNSEWKVPWTASLPAEFERRFGYDLIGRLPELFLRKNNEPVSQVKWHFLEILQQLFLENFVKPVSEWCGRHGLKLTGHGLQEDSLTAQTAMTGSLMRVYEHMQVPGVDVLTASNRCYWAVKQAASVARQLNKPQLLSELYGCTGWQMSFADHKAIGAWQTLFGVNLRCHHLSWYTMAGEAKRDCPGSILHQAGWWQDYHVVESYFARLGILLEHGRPCCDVLVLNPVESVWCQVYPGWCDGLTARDPVVAKLETAYRELFHWLAGAQIDFDYADEEMLARLGQVEPETSRLRVGHASYRIVVVPRMTTIRSSTIRLLEQFSVADGIVVVADELPTCIDALPVAMPTVLAGNRIPGNAESLKAVCRPRLSHPCEIVDAQTGEAVSDIFSQLRSDGSHLLLVGLNINADHTYENLRIRLKACGTVVEWECVTGRCVAVESRDCRPGWIEWTTSFAASAERAYMIGETLNGDIAPAGTKTHGHQHVFNGPFHYTLDEPNVCVLDFAAWRLNQQPWRPAQEILRVDLDVRSQLDMPLRGGRMLQPWYQQKYMRQNPKGIPLALRFEFKIDEIPNQPLWLCVEQPELWKIEINGVCIDSSKTAGTWIDIAFCKLAVPVSALKKGKNEIVLNTQFRASTDIEAIYLLGAFGVRLDGNQATLTRIPERLTLGDITRQGLPFYSGRILYRLPIDQKWRQTTSARLALAAFDGACVKVRSHSLLEQMIAWPPCEADVTAAVKNDDELQLELVLTRRNAFGPLHLLPAKVEAYGPDKFRTAGQEWCDNYQLHPAGLAGPPMLEVTAT